MYVCTVFYYVLKSSCVRSQRECVCVHTVFPIDNVDRSLCPCPCIFRRCFFLLFTSLVKIMLLFISLTVFVFLHLHSISSMYVCIFKLKIKHRIYRELICTQTKRYVACTAPRYFFGPDRIESNPVSCSLLICGLPDSRLHTTHTYVHIVQIFGVFFFCSNHIWFELIYLICVLGRSFVALWTRQSHRVQHITSR